MGEAVVTRIDGPAVESEIVGDMLRRGLWAVPAVLLVSGLVWGLDGALSTAYAMGLVALNFALSAALLGMAARISLAMIMASAMFGFLVRLGLVFLAVWLVLDASWVEVVPLALTIVIAHLGLLFWEMRFVSASLAFPGLRPETKETKA